MFSPPILLWIGSSLIFGLIARIYWPKAAEF